MLGQRFRSRPPAFEQIDALLSSYYREYAIEPGINHFVEARPDYEHLLLQADIVLSTALHDFQGLSMLEAAALGCYPVAPNALAYPEYLKHAGLYTVVGRTLAKQASGAADCILAYARQRDHYRHQHGLDALSASALLTKWQQTFTALFKS